MLTVDTVFGMRVEVCLETVKEAYMTYKIVSTLLLVIISAALLVNLAFKVKLNASSGEGPRLQTATKGCCGSGGGGCGAKIQNQVKGE